MTSVEQQAAEVIFQATNGVAEWTPELREDCNHYARALAEKNLLSPELPRPDRDGRWWPQAASIGNVNVNPAGEVVLHSGNFRDMQLHLTPAKARDLAAILTAAAAHAEKENES